MVFDEVTQTGLSTGFLEESSTVKEGTGGQFDSISGCSQFRPSGDSPIRRAVGVGTPWRFRLSHKFAADEWSLPPSSGGNGWHK